MFAPRLFGTATTNFNTARRSRSFPSVTRRVVRLCAEKSLFLPAAASPYRMVAASRVFALQGTLRLSATAMSRASFHSAFDVRRGISVNQDQAAVLPDAIVRSRSLMPKNSESGPCSANGTLIRANRQVRRKPLVSFGRLLNCRRDAQPTARALGHADRSCQSLMALRAGQGDMGDIRQGYRGNVLDRAV